MLNATLTVPEPQNEPVRPYLPGTPETASLKEAIARQAGETLDIPLIIGGKEVRTGSTQEIRSPHDHKTLLGVYHKAGPTQVEMACVAARSAYREWSETPWQDRMAVFRRAADLLAGPWRDTLNAATMLGQSKTCHQAEIDSACELIDFWRFNPWMASTFVYPHQPRSSAGVWNQIDYRPLEGFVFAITPFNFTSIAGNLPTAPAMMGNAVLWKPASSAVYSAHFIMRILEDAGLPPGVVNFIPGSGGQVGDPVLAQPDLAGVHFTGSTPVFQAMWKTVGDRIGNYRCYPRLVGETGGKDFVFAHASCDPDALVAALVRGAFEYQGQKCSAASRAYIPRSIYGAFKDAFLAEVESIPMGDPSDFRNFMAAVIDRGAYRDIMGYVEYARNHSGAEIVAGGDASDSEGFFIRPTVIECKDPHFKTMEEEIFGPVLSIFPYDDGKVDEALELCNRTSPYALTGAVFARDRAFLARASTLLRHAAGNYYVNDKPTGAVVGQQPFGGARGSGTNDKAGSVLNLFRWVSPRTIKENFNPPRDYRYSFMG